MRQKERAAGRDGKHPHTTCFPVSCKEPFPMVWQVAALGHTGHLPQTDGRGKGGGMNPDGFLLPPFGQEGTLRS